ncbi:MAG TPA: hypothetical protein VMF13_09310 [Luteitalea sp.]|nr:hypothetical protein [Luteitalea sp.]
MKALAEAGVKVDLVAGRGMGAASAMLAALDGGTRLWQPSGAWSGARAAHLYGWRLPWKLVGWALALCFVVLALPILVQVLAAVLYPFAYALHLTGLDRDGRLAGAFIATIGATFHHAVFAQVIPRVAVLSLLAAGLFLVAEYVLRARSHGRRRVEGWPWWVALGAPLDAQRAFTHFAHALWTGPVAGARTGDRRDLSRRYMEMIAEGLGQPGSAELLVVAHDLDTRRDLVFAALHDGWRRRFFGEDAAGVRASEVIDLLGAGRDLAMDGLRAALAVPLAAEPHALTFPLDSPWRGETHLVADRPEATVRLLEEVSAAGAEQVILVSAASPLAGPHGLSARRADPRACLGAAIAGHESASVRDAATAFFDRFTSVYHVQPVHNPLGPFDLAGTHDPRSDRHAVLGELVKRGYDDAYTQFIVPIVGGSAEGLEQPPLAPPPTVDDLPLT